MRTTKSTRRARLRKSEQLELQKLRREIKRYQDSYHNGVEEIPDQVYDLKEKRLRELAPDDPLLTRVGAEVKRGAKVTLPYRLDSLRKLYPGRTGAQSAEDWLSENPIFYAGDKLDGVSALHMRLSGKDYLYTRGNGKIGGNITHLLPHIKIGALRDGEAVRGELVMPESNFASNWAAKYPNSRSIVSSFVTSKQADRSVGKDILFIAHQMIKPDRPIYTADKYLTSRGYTVVPLKKFNNTNIKELQDYFEKRKKASKFNLDGLVFYGEDETVAFKVEGATALATISHIDWQLSKSGIYSPVAILKSPVQLSGVSVKRVTAVNARYVQTLGLGAGARVYVTRAGDVIPKIVGVEKVGKVEFPENSKWDSNRVQLILKKATQDDKNTIATKKLSESLRVLGVPLIRESSCAKLVEAGYDTILKLFKADDTDFYEAGLGASQADTLFTGLKTARLKASHAVMMRASMTFPDGWGLTRFETVLGHVTYERMYKMTNVKMKQVIAAIPGFSPTSASEFVDSFDDYVDFIEKLRWKPKKLLKSANNDSMKGVVIVFTGFRDKGLQEVIRARGGRVASGVTSKTTVLVTTNSGIIPKVKAAKAKLLGVRVMKLDQFAKAYGIQI